MTPPPPSPPPPPPPPITDIASNILFLRALKHAIAPLHTNKLKIYSYGRFQFD